MELRAILPKQKKVDTLVFLTSLFSSEDRLILAPMQNLTSLFFRKSFEKFFPKSFDYAITPFISATSNKTDVKSIHFKDILPQDNENSIPIVPQVIGNNREYILNTCKIIESLGYREVNLNMGCPKKDIVSRGRGAGMLTNPDSIQEIIETILKDTTLQVSIKVRLGVKDSSDCRKLVLVINSLPLKSVCIHPRKAIDFYGGSVDIDEFDYLANEIKHNVIYNGDIFSVEDFSNLKMRFPFIKHWMIGRGVLRNPLLAFEIRGMPAEKDILLKPFIKDVEENFIATLRSYNERLVLGKMKEFAKYLCKGLNIDEGPFVHSTSLEEINSLLNQI